MLNITKTTKSAIRNGKKFASENSDSLQTIAIGTGITAGTYVASQHTEGTASTVLKGAAVISATVTAYEAAKLVGKQLDNWAKESPSSEEKALA